MGRIDVLVNNAGYGSYGALEDVPMDEARYQFEVNVFGAARLTQLVLPHMRENRSGKIINITSMGGKIHTPLGTWYHATKFALEAISDCLRLELKPFGIDVIVIEPGGIRSDWGRHRRRQSPRRFQRRPVCAPGQPSPTRSRRSRAKGARHAPS
jgi:short-subunit dehydrogenase